MAGLPGARSAEALSKPIDQRRLLKRAAAARRLLAHANVDPALLLSYVVWPSSAGDERERAIRRELEARRVAEERAAALRLLAGGWLRGRSAL